MTDRIVWYGQDVAPRRGEPEYSRTGQSSHSQDRKDKTRRPVMSMDSFFLAGTGQQEQDICGRTAMTWKPGEDSWDRSSETGHPARIARTGTSGQSVLTGQPEQNGQKTTARTGKPGHLRQTIRTRQSGQDKQDKTVRTGKSCGSSPGRGSAGAGQLVQVGQDSSFW
jgi:hypothetical protein